MKSVIKMSWELSSPLSNISFLFVSCYKSLALSSSKVRSTGKTSKEVQNTLYYSPSPPRICRTLSWTETAHPTTASCSITFFTFLYIPSQIWTHRTLELAFPLKNPCLRLSHNCLVVRSSETEEAKIFWESVGVLYATSDWSLFIRATYSGLYFECWLNGVLSLVILDFMQKEPWWGRRSPVKMLKEIMTPYKKSCLSFPDQIIRMGVFFRNELRQKFRCNSIVGWSDHGRNWNCKDIF